MFLIVSKAGASVTFNSQPYKACVLSTYDDLKEHRAHVIGQLRRAGLVVDSMEEDPTEDWTADSDEPKPFPLDRLAGCDLCVLLVAFRRGCVPEGESCSMTQLEYDTAVTQGVEILPFLLDEDAPWPRKFDERKFDVSGKQDQRTKIAKWRSHLVDTHGRHVFMADPRSLDLTGALERWLAKKNGGQTGPALGPMT